MRNLLSFLIFLGLGAGVGAWIIVAGQRDLAARGLSGAHLTSTPPAVAPPPVEIVVPESPPRPDRPAGAAASPPPPFVLRLNDGRVRLPAREEAGPAAANTLK